MDSILSEVRQLVELAQRAAETAGQAPDVDDLNKVRATFPMGLAVGAACKRCCSMGGIAAAVAACLSF